uniref:Uncharacterized protein n=1 Tax=Candidatus Kentrum sp. TC TaxID=2126339 RepID=A0A451A9N5_9GAMM|nr:MAG: hypothetical protein BECKTC1821F_GA0114240_107910 [Candidatus Kentron sp. TC]
MISKESKTALQASALSSRFSNKVLTSFARENEILLSLIFHLGAQGRSDAFPPLLAAYIENANDGDEIISALDLDVPRLSFNLEKDFAEAFERQHKYGFLFRCVTPAPTALYPSGFLEKDWHWRCHFWVYEESFAGALRKAVAWKDDYIATKREQLKAHMPRGRRLLVSDASREPGLPKRTTSTSDFTKGFSDATGEAARRRCIDAGVKLKTILHLGSQCLSHAFSDVIMEAIGSDRNRRAISAAMGIAPPAAFDWDEHAFALRLTRQEQQGFLLQCAFFDTDEQRASALSTFNFARMERVFWVYAETFEGAIEKACEWKAAHVASLREEKME